MLLNSTHKVWGGGGGGGVRHGKRGKLTLNYCVILNEYVYGDKYCINKEK